MGILFRTLYVKKIHYCTQWANYEHCVRHSCKLFDILMTFFEHCSEVSNKILQFNLVSRVHGSVVILSIHFREIRGSYLRQAIIKFPLAFICHSRPVLVRYLNIIAMVAFFLFLLLRCRQRLGVTGWSLQVQL